MKRVGCSPSLSSPFLSELFFRSLTLSQPFLRGSISNAASRSDVAREAQVFARSANAWVFLKSEALASAFLASALTSVFQFPLTPAPA